GMNVQHRPDPRLVIAVGQDRDLRCKGLAVDRATVGSVNRGIEKPRLGGWATVGGDGLRVEVASSHVASSNGTWRMIDATPGGKTEPQAASLPATMSSSIRA